MPTNDGHNLSLVTSVEQVDRINAEFYGKIRYPAPPMHFERVVEPSFWASMLDQEIGRRDHPVLPDRDARIWVAGCGTNQALITALKFPKASVLGSDLSAESLELCRRNATQMGVTNLELKRESLNQA